jgi:membrane fusion protein, multidrug efflux system
LSVTADVDVRDESGPQVTINVGPGITRADTGEDSGPVADRLIATILRENGANFREAARNVR